MSAFLLRTKYQRECAIADRLRVIIHVMVQTRPRMRLRNKFPDLRLGRFGAHLRLAPDRGLRVTPEWELRSNLRTILRTTDPNLATTDIHTMGELVSEATARRRFQTTLLTAFAAMAMLLGMVGIYGLLAYSVKQRASEIGVRIALGASRERVLGMILWQGLRLTVAGLIWGWPVRGLLLACRPPRFTA
jgi:hypothetical protein